MNEVIRVENLSKEFSGLSNIRLENLKNWNFKALDKVSFTINQGEVFGFLGPNGAGKTTTIKILTGLIFPTSGSAYIFNKKVPSVGAKEKIGFLPEIPTFYDYLNARELLKYYGQLFNLPKKTIYQRTEKLLGLVGLSNDGDKPLRKFSKGMIQRVGIAQALINEPELIILDEPMSGLDPLGRKEIRDIIFQLRREGKTIFFSTHILSDVEHICDRIGILNRGKLKGIGNLNDLLSPKIISSEIVVKGIPREKFAELGQSFSEMREFEGNFTLIFEGAIELNAIIQKLIQLGGNLISATPRRQTLEDLFIEEVKGK